MASGAHSVQEASSVLLSLPLHACYDVSFLFYLFMSLLLNFIIQIDLPLSQEIKQGSI